MSCFPFGLTLWLFEKLSGLGYVLMRERRRRVLEHLTIAFGGEKSEAEIKSIARGAFLNYCRSIAELVHMRHPEKLLDKLTIELEGEENIEPAFKPGNGIVFATAHFGNWELMAAHMARVGHRVNVVARSMHDGYFDRWLNETRAKAGTHVIKRGNRDLELFRCLRRNEGLGILFDLDTDGPGVFVDFLGQPAYTQTGPVALALRLKSSILPGFIHRTGRLSHKIVIYPPLEFRQDAEADEEKIVDGLNQLNAILEKEIRAHPTEWAWMHRRWRHTPRDDEDEQ